MRELPYVPGLDPGKQGRDAAPGSDPPPLEAIRDGARLAALRDLELLDAAPVEAVDRLTRLATELLGVPVSLVSLVDEDRQFFLSGQGLPASLAGARETPLSHSFCKHVVARRENMIVKDAREEDLFRDNPAVRDLDVIAYAGVPLILEGGAAVGALCAIDSGARDWTQREVALLEDLASAVKTFLDLRAALARQGLHDRLTGLPNRDLLIAHCNEMLEEAEDGRMVAVICAGLDSFSQINQAFGATRADGALTAVAERLRSSIREGDVLGRLRGDVFTIVAPGVRDEAEALTVAGRIRSALAREPFQVGDETLSIGASAGIATAARGAHGADVISEAANAMHQAKRHRDGVRFNEDGWSVQATEQIQLRQALHSALDEDQIAAVYQPIVELDTGRLSGFEALARWRHPDLGDIAPERFIPLAEMTGDIVAIGAWMLDRALGQLASWRAEGRGELRVTVNVSPIQLAQGDFAGRVETCLHAHELPGEALGLEITEGALMDTSTTERENLAALTALGVRIVLDDFGTGYSALSYIRRFPLDVIKIDRSFTSDLSEDHQAAALVQAIIAMARGMDLEVIAEGVETREQRKFLRLLGCRMGQGYLFSRPVPAEQVRFEFPAP